MVSHSFGITPVFRPMMEQVENRPPGWAPKGAKLVQLKDGRKRPATSTGHLAGVLADDFEPLGENVGIVLDGQFVLVDTDRPGASAEWDARLPPTWTQKTPRGTHRLYRVPPGWRAVGQIKWAAGECKSLGYAVAPGSWIDPAHEENAGHPGGVYRLLDGRDPSPAPSWLLDLFERATGQERAVTAAPADERDEIPDGERDNALTEIAGFLRRKQFSERALAAALTALVDSGVVEQPPGREVTADDCRRIARSIARKPVGESEMGFVPVSWECATDIEIVSAPVRWWLRDFIPRGELVMLYGKGGIGKSSAMSWLASLVTKKNANFAFVGIEESFRRFAGRAILCGAERSRLFGAREASKIQLPQGIAALEEAIAVGNYDVVCFDSIYSHFDLTPGLNAAERARRVLGPLAELAQRSGCTIIGIFHERKDGDTFLGSVEMVNVARYALRAARVGTGPLRLSVEKTNGREIDYRMTFGCDLVPLVDMQTGEPQLEEDDQGRLVPYLIGVPRRGPDEPINSVDVDTLSPLIGNKGAPS